MDEINNTDSPATTSLMTQVQKEPDVDFREYAKSLGVDVETIEGDYKKEKKAAQPKVDMMGDTGVPQSAMQGTDASTTKDVAKGAAFGVADVTQNVLNFGADIADGAENLASSFGMGTGDLISGSDRIDWSSKLGTPEDSLATRSARTITTYAAPVLAGVVGGAGVVSGLAIGALVDMATIDPKQERLSTMLRDNVPELQNFPLAYNAVSKLANNPDDTNLDSRFKNAVEGVLVGGGAMLAAAGLAKTFTGLVKAGSKVSQYGKQIRAMTEAGAKPEQIAEVIAKPLAAEADVAAAEMKMGSNVVEDANVIPNEDVYKFDPIIENKEGKKVFNVNNSELVETIAAYKKANPTTVEDFQRGPKSSPELLAQAEAIKNDPEALQKILDRRKEQRPLNDAETKVILMADQEMKLSLFDLAKQAPDGEAIPNELKAQVINHLKTQDFIDNVRGSSGSDTGRGLNVHKEAADLENTTVPEFLKKMGTKARNELLDDMVKAHGGAELTDDFINNIKAIGQLSDAGAVDKLEALAKIPKTNLRIAADAATATALNGMLSVKTLTSNVISNTLSMGNSVAENYVAAAYGAFAKGNSKVSFAQADGYAKGIMSAWMESMGAAGQAFRTGKAAGPAAVMKGDFKDVTEAISAKAFKIPVDESNAYKLLGNVVDGAGLMVGLPTRINSTGDAFFGTMMYRGKIYQDAIRRAEEQSLKGAEKAAYINKVISDPVMSVHNLAKEHAKEYTFSRALREGSVLKSVNDLVERTPLGLGKVLFPYQKTTFNIVEYALNRSPLGLIHPQGEIRQALAAGGAQKATAMAKVTLGGMYLGAAAGMAAMGVITGPETRNYRMKQALEESGQGWQPDSIRVGDKFYAYGKIDPFASYLRLGAVMSNLVNHVEADEYDQLAAVAMTAVADFMTPEMMVDGYGKFFQALGEEASYQETNVPSAFAKDVFSRFTPLGAIQRDIKGQLDPYKRDTSINRNNANPLEKVTEMIMNRYKSISPWLSDDLPVQRNIFGEPLMTADGWGPDMVSPITVTKKGGTDVMNKLNKLVGFKEELAPLDPDVPLLEITAPSRTFSVEGIKMNLSPHEYEKYMMLAGGLNPETGKAIVEGATLRDIVEQTLSVISPAMEEKDITVMQYKKMVGVISKAITSRKESAKAMMMMDPAFAARWQKAVEASQQPINKELEAQ